MKKKTRRCLRDDVCYFTQQLKVIFAPLFHVSLRLQFSFPFSLSVNYALDLSIRRRRQHSLRTSHAHQWTSLTLAFPGLGWRAIKIAVVYSVWFKGGRKKRSSRGQFEFLLLCPLLCPWRQRGYYFPLFLIYRKHSRPASVSVYWFWD